MQEGYPARLQPRTPDASSAAPPLRVTLNLSSAGRVSPLPVNCSHSSRLSVGIPLSGTFLTHQAEASTPSRFTLPCFLRSLLLALLRLFGVVLYVVTR